MIIAIINVDHVAAREPEYHSPVRADRYRPKAFQIALERMQPKSRQVHITRRLRGLQPGKDISQFRHVLRNDAT